MNSNTGNDTGGRGGGVRGRAPHLLSARYLGAISARTARREQRTFVRGVASLQNGDRSVWSGARERHARGARACVADAAVEIQ